MAIQAFDTTAFPDFIGHQFARRRVLRTLRSDPKGAGDQRRPMSGPNILWEYTLGWNSLSRDQGNALLTAGRILAGAHNALFFFDWHTSPAFNLVIGTGNGSGAARDLALQATLRGQSPNANTPSAEQLALVAASGLSITRDGLPLTHGVDWSIRGSIGANFVTTVIRILPAANLAAAVFAASWTAARRRRTMRLVDDSAIRVRQRPDSLALWAGSATLVETVPTL